jgi:23S rRNA (uridine2552-2'-O)-methyltransferase
MLTAMPVARKKHRSNPEWIRRHVTDPYVKAATQHGYRSRAAYKLVEIDAKDKLLRPGQTVLDLGAAPGSWAQVVRERLTGRDRVRGRVIALDILPMDPLPDVEFIQGDFRDEAVAAALATALGGTRVDVVLSDMAPNLSGIAAADAARSLHLAELALEFALAHLKPTGVLLVKAFQGSGYSQFVEQLKRHFVSVAVRKPPASRTESAETYLLARGLKFRVNPDGRSG